MLRRTVILGNNRVKLIPVIILSNICWWAEYLFHKSSTEVSLIYLYVQLFTTEQLHMQVTYQFKKFKIPTLKIFPLKGQCHEIFDHYFFWFGLKFSTWVPHEQAKTVSQTFSFSRIYSIIKLENRVSTMSLNQFCLFIWGSGGVFFKIKSVEALVTLSL